MRPYFSMIMEVVVVVEASPASTAPGKYIRDKMDLINLSENVRMTKNLCARTSRMIELGSCSDIEYYTPHI